MEEEKQQNNIEELKSKLEEAEKMRDEYLAGWQRQKADFLNYQKDTLKQTQEIVKYANEDLVADLLVVLDSFEISVNSLAIEGLTETEKRIIQGLELIKAQLEDVLRRKGLKAIEALNQQFNPAFHEVMEEVEGNEKPGTIVEEIIKGYEFNGRIIRPSKVKIVKNN
ncbi:MAG TPA: nucleotide exchange factor GrpE [Candidatus Paceibacterota bacterium]|nr:nucleotide exchange factor GrpE [Candidatus Paceibacterota bacterium]HPT40090.1 nucleotide exchange factor GrpE [Candidatus Paceibacterota bacterium]